MRISPSFVGYETSVNSRTQSKKSNGAKGTQPELLLHQALTLLGVAHRLNVSELPGKPDAVIDHARVAVFCDGTFWHGKDWDTLRSKLERGSNASYWVPKIAYNKQRDKRINEELSALGWIVVRVWEDEVRKDPESIARRLKATTSNSDDSPSDS